MSTPEPTTVICGTIAHVPGCVPITCSLCGRDLVAAPTTMALLAKGPVVVLCYDCAPAEVPRGAEIGITKEQAAELVAALGMKEADRVVRAHLRRPISDFL